MSVNANDTIRLRNEGMVYALKIAKEHGVDGLQEQVELRGLLKVSVKFTPEELNSSIDSLSESIYNNMLTMTYAVLHDEYGYGEKRLKRFKEHFDQKVYLVGEEDPAGRHYVRFEDYATEANRLYQLGIDMATIQQTQLTNDTNGRKYVAVDEVISWLRKKGYTDAADAVHKDAYEPHPKPPMSQKQRQAAECRRNSDRKNKYYTDDAYEENIEYWFNIFGSALAGSGMTAGQIRQIWEAADSLNGEMADGKKRLKDVKAALLEKSGIMCEFTKMGGAEDYVETA